ncbi:MAG: hypothetical protein QM817_22780 [Archangium sp.]
MISLVCALALSAAPHQLTSVHAALKPLRDAYPSRVDTQKLFLAAVEGAARVEPLIVTTRFDETLLVSVTTETMTFELGGITTLSKMHSTLEAFVAFVERALEQQKAKPNVRTLELAMLAGLLRSLEDRHSRLVEPNEARQGHALEDGVCVSRFALAGELAMKLVVRRELCR